MGRLLIARTLTTKAMLEIETAIQASRCFMG
jgi:hypothetical protein